MSGLNHAAYGLPVNASRPGSPQAHASLGSGWRPTLAGWDWIPTGFRTRFQRSHHGILSPLTGLSRHTRWCTTRDSIRDAATFEARHRPMLYDCDLPSSVIRFKTLHASSASVCRPPRVRARMPPPMIDLYRKNAFSTRACRWYPDAFFHRRRPSTFTLLIVRSRTRDRGPRRETDAVRAGGTTTVSASRASLIVERDGVVGGIRRHAGEFPVHLLDQTLACRGVIGRRFGQCLGDNDARSVDTQMELLPATLAAPAVFGRGPFPFAHHNDRLYQAKRSPFFGADF